MRILALLSHLLGNRVFSDRLLEALTGCCDVDVFPVLLESTDYGRVSVPRFIRVSESAESEFVFRSKLRSLQLPDYDAVVVNGYGLLKAALPTLKRTPVVLATDTTPALQFDQKDQPKSAWKRVPLLAWNQLAGRAFRAMADRVTVFLPMSQWCADSLRNHYGLGRWPMLITRCPQRDVLSRVPPRPRGDKCQLLFVGNDFDRKGGNFLLSVFEQFLQHACDLVIVSNDATLLKAHMPQGVTLVSGLQEPSQILQIYRRADLLVLPTKQDQYSHVICESFSQGLPCVASGVGGISELVAESSAGILVSTEKPAGDWADAILEFARSAERCARFQENALRFANERLTMAQFRRDVQMVVDSLRDELPAACSVRHPGSSCSGRSAVFTSQGIRG